MPLLTQLPLAGITARKLTILSLTGVALIASCRTHNGDSTATEFGEGERQVPPFLGSVQGAVAPAVKSLSLETNNASAFQAKLDIIAKATKTIDISYYIVMDGYSTAAFYDALLERAKAGVRVRILMDDNDHNQEGRVRLDALRALSGGKIEVAIFRPMTAINDALTLIKNLKARQQEMQATFGQLAGLINPFALQGKEVEPIDLDKLPVPDPARIERLLLVIDELMQSHGTFGETVLRLLDVALGTNSLSSLKAAEIAELLKRSHHKLIVVDNTIVSGGGRNLWDISHMNHGHPLRPIGVPDVNAKNDLDTDYFLEDPTIAAEATKTFESYWGCLGGLGAPTCVSGIPVERLATPENAPSAEHTWKSVKADAAKFASQRDRSPTYPVLFSSKIQGENLPVAYLENRMWKTPGTRTDEPSRYLEATVKLLAEAKPQDEILLVNAYMIMPPAMLAQVMQAMKAGAKVTLITNGENITDNKTVALFTRIQAESLLRLAKDLKVDANFTYIENRSDEQLHTKATVVGDWLIVGSANADPRSAYLNTENGVLIGPAPVTLDGEIRPSAAAAYKELIQKTLATYASKKVTDRNGSEHSFFDKVSLEELSALLDVPQGPSKLDYLRYRLNRTFRNMAKTATRLPPDRFGESARESLYEQVLIQF